MQLAFAASVDCVLIAFAFAFGVYRIPPQSGSAVLAALVERVEIDVELFELRHVAVVARSNALACFQSSVRRRHPFAHHLDHSMRAVDLDALFAATCLACRADFVINEQPAADERRIAYATRYLECKPAGRRRA